MRDDFHPDVPSGYGQYAPEERGIDRLPEFKSLVAELTASQYPMVRMEPWVETENLR